MNIIDFFKTGKILLLDGATGSQLIAKGLQAGECPELWNINRPADIQAVARAYFNAGSDAVLTNTFGGSKIKLKAYNLENKVHELNYTAVINAQKEKPVNGYVLGSIGPSGQFLEPIGEISETEMVESFAEQVVAMDKANIDGFMLETFIDLSEMLCAIKAIKENSELPFFTSMTFDYTPDGYKTMMGVSIEEAAKTLSEAGALAVGSNCGNGIQKMIEVGKAFRAVSKDLKILVKANAGEPKLVDGKTIYTEDAAYFSKFADELLSFNPSVIGGCCGTSPEHIKEFRKIINKIS
jgi:5-methyltetrahydrofolate--homocysteine methyltransferase